MKIHANRADDIRRQREEYDQAAQAQQKRHDDQYDEFRKARYTEFEKVADEVRSKIGHIMPNLDIRVEEADWDEDADRLRVSVSSNQNRVHAEDKALSWDWSAKLKKTGEVEKSSGSWSGLNACTAEQLADLRKTLEVLEVLNAMDWATVLKHALPKFGEYVTERSPSRHDRPDFESQIFQAEIEDAIGQPVLFKGNEHEYRGWWYAILGQTEKQYRVVNIPAYLLTEEEYRQGKSVADLIEQYAKFNVQRVMKSKFETMLKKPLVKWEDK